MFLWRDGKDTSEIEDDSRVGMLCVARGRQSGGVFCKNKKFKKNERFRFYKRNLTIIIHHSSFITF